MNSISVDFEHCYGIKRLQATFDFRSGNAYAVYAPNGMMKSSFAQAFKDIASGTSSKDRIFPNRTTKRAVTDDLGNPVSPEDILVLPPYDEVFGDAEKTATLLVDATLRKEYESLYTDIDKAKARFLKAMKQQSGSKKNLEEEISRTFTKSSSEFYQALIRVQHEVASLPTTQFADVPYDLISDEKVAAFLATQDVKAMLQAYIEQYNKLLEQSQYFRKGTFDYYNAATVAKALSTNGFFQASHSVTLHGSDRVEVTDEGQLAAVIAEEKAAILRDAELRKAFNEMEKRITKNNMLRDFQEFLADHEEVLALMGNLEKLKEDVWKSYFKAHESAYDELIAMYHAAAVRSKEIEAEAVKQQTQWERVIEIFNRRFFVPFKLVAKNKVSVMLGGELAPVLGFTFCQDDESAEVERHDLLQVLSAGEKKALYILNVIFEVEVRRQAGQRTIFVVDDIADSFDYKNKYAIVQYLKEIGEEDRFRVIMLTHNFDFFRTVNGRGIVPYNNCLMVQRTTTGLELVQAAGIRNVFVNDWKRQFFTDGRKRLAAIAFIRNIVEYTRGEENPEYATLTSLLHWKNATASITNGELDRIFTHVFAESGSFADPSAPVLTSIRTEASACLGAPQGTNFENKIVLAIAIRLEAERHMAAAIADETFLSSIRKNQTARLLAKYAVLPGVAPEKVGVGSRSAHDTREHPLELVYV